MIIRALARFLFCVMLFSLPSAAQTGPLADSTGLLDVSFFRNPVVGKKTKDIYNSSDIFSKRLEEARLVKLLTAKEDDRQAEMVITAIMGMLHFDNGDYRTALDYYSEALALDSAVDKSSPLRERSLKIMANSFGMLGATDMAITMNRYVIDIAEKRDRHPTTRLYHYYTDMAGMMNQAGNTDSAYICFRKATAITTQLGIPLWQSSSYNNLGYCFLINNQLDSAEACFRKSLQVFIPRDSLESLFTGSITDNLGQTLVKKGKYEEALLLFKNNISRFRDKDDGRFLNACVSAVEMQLQLGHNQEAEGVLSDLENYISTKKFALNPQRRLQFISARRDVYAATGRMKEALQLSRSFNSINDSLLNAERNKKIAALDFLLSDRTAKFRTQLQLERTARMQEQARASYARWLLAAVATIGLLLVTLIIMLYRRRVLRMRVSADEEALQRKQAELELAREQLETEKLSRELELKRRDVTDMAIHISVRKKLSEELLERLRTIKQSADPEKELQALILELRSTQASSDENRLLPENVEQVNHEFFEKLKSLYPDLTRSEIDLCGLIRLRVPMKEVARLRNISAHAVRVAKHRLKKKMGLPHETELDDFIAKL